MKDDTNKEADVVSDPVCPVNSYTEWDPLEEVIVGVLEGARFLGAELLYTAAFPPELWDQVVAKFGVQARPYPRELVDAADKQLNEFIHILEAEGVKVRRPDIENSSLPYATPAWGVDSGFGAVHPRDIMMVIGNEIIEAPMADQHRYFETWPYRSLLKEYFKAGAKWTMAPKPQLLKDQYVQNYEKPGTGEPARYLVTDFEPTFDAADFTRCGRDIFTQKSLLTNELGIQWVQRHLGDEYRVHCIESDFQFPLHIDVSLVPMAPGKVMINPDHLTPEMLPDIFKTWDILIPPEPVNVKTASGFDVAQYWTLLNILMLDEKRVIVDSSQEPLIKAFKDWGFEPVSCAFEACWGSFFGSFHCATLDVRRRGSLQSYF